MDLKAYFNESWRSLSWAEAPRLGKYPLKLPDLLTQLYLGSKHTCWYSSLLPLFGLLQPLSIYVITVVLLLNEGKRAACRGSSTEIRLSKLGSGHCSRSPSTTLGTAWSFPWVNLWLLHKLLEWLNQLHRVMIEDADTCHMLGSRRCSGQMHVYKTAI